MIGARESIQDRIARLDWTAMTRELDNFGCTIVKAALSREKCRSIAAMYQRDDISVARLSWPAMDLVEASTNTGHIRCRQSSLTFGPRYMRHSQRWPTGGIS